jgi:hypothetical protein
MSSAATRYRIMHFDDILGIILTLAGLAYCTYAMLRPEKF